MQLVSKDLYNASKLKKCAILSEWNTSICNMLWWSFRNCNGKHLTQLVLWPSLKYYILWKMCSNENCTGNFALRKINCFSVTWLYKIVKFLEDTELLTEMVLSIPLHIQDIHVFPENKKFKVHEIYKNNVITMIID